MKIYPLLALTPLLYAQDASPQSLAGQAAYEAYMRIPAEVRNYLFERSLNFYKNLQSDQLDYEGQCRALMELYKRMPPHAMPEPYRSYLVDEHALLKQSYAQIAHIVTEGDIQQLQEQYDKQIDELIAQKYPQIQVELQGYLYLYTLHAYLCNKELEKWLKTADTNGLSYNLSLKLAPTLAQTLPLAFRQNNSCALSKEELRAASKQIGKERHQIIEARNKALLEKLALEFQKVPRSLQAFAIAYHIKFFELSADLYENCLPHPPDGKQKLSLMVHAFSQMDTRAMPLNFQREWSNYFINLKQNKAPDKLIRYVQFESMNYLSLIIAKRRDNEQLYKQINEYRMEHKLPLSASNLIRNIIFHRAIAEALREFAAEQGLELPYKK